MILKRESKSEVPARHSTLKGMEPFTAMEVKVRPLLDSVPATIMKSMGATLFLKALILLHMVEAEPLVSEQAQAIRRFQWGPYPLKEAQ